jgi:hypothetical protein
MIESNYKKESKLTFEIEPLTRVEALREGNKLKDSGESNIVLYNQNDKTYSVFNKDHYDYLMNSGEVDMKNWKEIKEFEASEVQSDKGVEVVQKEPTPESNDNLDIEFNEPVINNVSDEVSEEFIDDELTDDENIDKNNLEEGEEDMDVEYNKTTPDEMEEIIKKENYNRKLNENMDKYNFELNPILWDIDGIINELDNNNINYEVENYGKLRTDIVIDINDHGRVYNIIYGELKPGFSKYWKGKMRENYHREFSQVDRVWNKLPEGLKSFIKRKYNVAKLTFSQLEDIIKTHGKSFNYSMEARNINKRDAINFENDVKEIILTNGGSKLDEPKYTYKYTINTKYGKLLVSPDAKGTIYTIFTRFENPELIKNVDLSHINKYSGKWNFHSSDYYIVADFERELKNIL